ncbi:galactokinase [Rhabdothermincola sediminis]|uniref:galactokinase n=1 Tax=Rhabdothermincola sediminis TaxID=2751370 RepID=UPI001AA08F8B|nr:galactokinase family protein [Rhabdothermincola sediminis]
MSGPRVRARAPGRVNLIGDHTDYAGGLAVPMAIDLETVVTGTRGGGRVRLRSASEPLPADLPLEVADPSTVDPPWARYPAGVVAELRPPLGFTGEVHSTVPVGSGLSSSAALEVSLALALGYEGDPIALARLCQRAEQRACGVPSGIMDQLTSILGRAGNALLIDFATLTVTEIDLPPGIEIVVVHSGQPRALAGSAYADRRRDVERAIAELGPLRDRPASDAEALTDPVLRRRARHVIGENARVLAFAGALRRGELREAGALMVESHRSLRDDFEVSTPVLDELVARLVAAPGVLGARLTGAGFGGCVVALGEPGALADEGWHVHASDGATVTVEGG